MAICQTEISADGFDVIRLYNACLSVSVMPQLGGKIYQINDRVSGRDWLWNNPYIPLRHPFPDLNYERDFDSGGWDEILFSVKSCELEQPDGQRVSIGDHGLVVDRPWLVAETGVNQAGEAFCELFAQGDSPDFRFHRRISMDAERPRLRLEYVLTNTGSQPWPWLWCAHPLLAIEDNMRIHVRKNQPLRPPCEWANDKQRQAWPWLTTADGSMTNLAGIFEQSVNLDTFCQKLFVKSDGKVSLVTSDGKEFFSLEQNPDDLPWLGLWINKNAWSGCGSTPYLNLGLEPATAPNDTLTHALTEGHASVLQAGESKTWSLSILTNSGAES